MYSFEEIDAINCFAGDKIFPLIMKHGREITKKAGELLYFFGDRADGLFYIHTGKIRGFYLDEDGKDQTCVVVPAGMFVGEDSFTTSLTRVVGVDVISDSVLYYITRDQLLELCQNDTELLHQLLGIFVKKMFTFLNNLNAVQQKGAKEKVAYYLLQMNRTTSEPMDFTHERIADVIGVSRGTVTKILSEFEQAGFIRVKYKAIEIISFDKLFELID